MAEDPTEYDMRIPPTPIDLEELKRLAANSQVVITGYADAAMFNAAKTALPALIAEVERLRAGLEKQQEIADNMSCALHEELWKADAEMERLRAENITLRMPRYPATGGISEGDLEDASHD